MSYFTPLKLNDRDEEVKLLQKALNEKMLTRLAIDGHLGGLTQKALIQYQSKHGLKTTGIYDEATYESLADFIDQKYIRVEDIDNYAQAIQVEPAMLKALAIKEAKASGFTPSGRCLILYERHRFYKEVVDKFGEEKARRWSREFPNLCYKSWTKDAYFGGEREYLRLDKAKDLDPECALKACSWGMFQIMGFNHRLCMYDTVGEFVRDMMISEKFHLEALANFIRSNTGLYRALKLKDFNKIAYYYNGKSYHLNNYHNDLRRIYQRVS